MCKTQSQLFKTEWTGRYPSLCCGEWKLYRRVKYLDEYTKMFYHEYEDISHMIPEDIKHEPMYTLGVYEEWYFDNNNRETFGKYENGCDFEEWCKENESWIHNICDPKDYKDLYEAFNEEDWRYNSCGGCI